MADERLTQEFHLKMLEIYEAGVSECNYRASRFLQMVQEYRGLGTAKILLATQGHSEGLTKLWECGRLDISVEALVLQEPWRLLFTSEERATALHRLQELGFDPTR